MSWSEIVAYRQQFYVQNYDVRIVCENGEAPQSVAEKTVKKWKELETRKFYISTRSVSPRGSEVKTFLDVVIQGLACDGGLYVPQAEIPYFTLGKF